MQKTLDTGAPVRGAQRNVEYIEEDAPGVHAVGLHGPAVLRA